MIRDELQRWLDYYYKWLKELKQEQAEIDREPDPVIRAIKRKENDKAVEYVEALIDEAMGRA